VRAFTTAARKRPHEIVDTSDRIMRLIGRIAWGAAMVGFMVLLYCVGRSIWR
jgi:hypothetical protein